LNMPIVKQKQLYEKYDSAIQTALQPVRRLCMKGWILRADDLNDNRTGYQGTDKKQMGPPVVAIQQDGQAEQIRSMVIESQGDMRIRKNPVIR